MFTEIAIILALVILNGIFAAAEIAVISLRGSRLDSLLASGSKRALAVKRLRDNPEQFLATVQIGMTVVSVIASAFGGASLARDLQPLLARIPGVGGHAESAALALVVVLISYLTLVAGELIPKSLALRFSERYALFIGRPLLRLSSLTRPLVWFLTASSNAVLRRFGDHTTFTEARLSREELQQLVEEAAKVGSVDRNAGEIASRAFDFADLTAAQVMVPRNRVVAVPCDAPPDEVRRIVREKRHTRMPVYEGALDNVVGFVNVKDILARSCDGELVIREVLRAPYFIAETMHAASLLNEMKRRRMQFAVVVDELGAMSGIVTLEDLVEEIVGDIAGEYETAKPATIRPEADGSFLVDGDTPVRDVNRALDLDLPEGQGRSTIAGLCLELAGQIPPVGERLRAPDGTTLEIVDASPRHVRTVRVRRGES